MAQVGMSRVSTSTSSLTASTHSVTGSSGPSGPTPPPAVRRELRSMPPADQERFMDALIKMMEDTSGPQTSEYFRIAGYHGWPGGYCAHGVETFPAWHRAYLKEFENALKAADRAVGRDGTITLPYWDWTNLNYPDVFPEVVRRRLAQMPANLITANNALRTNGYSRITSDSRLRQLILANNLIGSNSVVWQALLEPVHWRHASTENVRTPSVETPHNLMHVLCGFPMTVVDYAAFHPIFFLHHCNVDRLWAAYLAANPDSKEEMARHQLSLLSRRLNRTLLSTDTKRPRTLYEQPLEPFKNSKGRSYTAADMFTTTGLGYAYDLLPQVPPQQIREAPTLALFQDIDIVGAMSKKSFMLHVFVLSPDDAPNWVMPTDTETLHEQPGYAGTTAVFGGKGEECENCRTNRKPITVGVDVTEAVKKLNLSRFVTQLRVAVEDEEGNLMPLESVPIPAPVLEGPYFEDVHQIPLAYGPAPEGQNPDHHAALVTQLQRVLNKFGYYKDVVDGDFGPVTDAALRRLQKFLKLKVDGVAGPITKTALLRPRYDALEDADEVAEDTPIYQVAEAVTWFLDLPPGYLDMDVVRVEVVKALAEWAEVVPLFFKEVDTAEEAMVKIYWSDATPDNMFKFDGTGGSLAYTKDGSITLDEAERWLLQGQEHTLGAFYLLPVLLHEVGHVLGLTHSDVADDVMSPYYEPTKIKLAPGDQERAVALYPLEAQYAQVFHVLDQDHDGLLSREELINALTSRGSQPLSVAEAEMLWMEAAGRPTTSAGGSAVRTASGSQGIDLKRFLQLITRYFYGDAPSASGSS